MGRLHNSLSRAVEVFNRNPWTFHRLELLPRDDHPFYEEDGLWTHHGHPFVDDPRFQRAYKRAVKAGGFDYGIGWRVHTLLWAAELADRADGAFVECGTGRGFMASAICDYLEWRDRPFYLYDTFKHAAPNEAGEQPERGESHTYYASGPEPVAENFSEWPGVELVIGRIPSSLGRSPDEVAFLHVDMNHPRAEEAAVRHFWPRLAGGGVMVYDDYGFQGFEAQREAADRLADEFGFSVLALPTGQGLAVKSQ